MAAPLVDELLEGMKSVVMMPFSSLSQALPKMVRDLARAEGKAVDLQVTGGDIEIDRHVLETIKDPIVHILRNCVGHGIETPDVRTGKGKPVRGIVAMAIERGDGNDISIIIRDDGAGIDVGRLRSAALEAGALRPDELERLADDDLLTLVFESGVTTNAIVTDVAGRGIGLAIVLEKDRAARRPGGSQRALRAGQGAPRSSFTVPGHTRLVPGPAGAGRRPAVRAADRCTSSASLACAWRRSAPIESTETVMLDGAERRVRVPARRPRAAAPGARRGRRSAAGGGPHRPATSAIAFAVDWILGEQEILVKPLGSAAAQNVRYVTGATILESESGSPSS
jgi:two-component system chemotaxis sensor kinase CheA